MNNIKSIIKDGENQFLDAVIKESNVIEEIKPIRVTEKVTENQSKIIKLLEETPKITSLELSKILKIYDRKVKENLKK